MYQRRGWEKALVSTVDTPQQQLCTIEEAQQICLNTQVQERQSQVQGGDSHCAIAWKGPTAEAFIRQRWVHQS